MHLVAAVVVALAYGSFTLALPEIREHWLELSRFKVWGAGASIFVGAVEEVLFRGLIITELYRRGVRSIQRHLGQASVTRSHVGDSRCDRCGENACAGRSGVRLCGDATWQGISRSTVCYRESIESKLRQHVDRLAGLIGPRTLQRPKTIQATIGYIKGQWDEMGYHTCEEVFDAIGDSATNLVVEKVGTEDLDEIVLLGAHYDTVSTTPGADDNASAVAVLLEVSRLLCDFRGKRTARLVAFACEEPPYFNLDAMGSQHHARQSRQRSDRVVGMLCLEMVGYFRDELGSQRVPPTIPRFLHRFFPQRGNFLAAVGNPPSWKLAWSFRRGFKRGTRMPQFSIVLPEQIHEIRLSDNSSFWDQSYPALMLTDTSFLRNPHYHLESATIHWTTGE